MSLEEIQIRKINSLNDRNEASISFQNQDIDICFTDKYCFFSSDSYDLEELNMKYSKGTNLDINSIIKIFLDYIKFNSTYQIKDVYNVFNVNKKKNKKFN